MKRSGEMQIDTTNKKKANRLIDDSSSSEEMMNDLDDIDGDSCLEVLYKSEMRTTKDTFEQWRRKN